MLKPGWLEKQFKEAKEGVETWPKWMRRTSEEIDAERKQHLEELNGRVRSLGRDPDSPLSIHQ